MAPGSRLRARHALFDKLVYGKLRAAVGGQVVAAVSGSAPLGERLGHFFRGVGLPVLEGYGLTETTAGITVNTLGAQRIGSVGRPVPGHGVRIADDGEILLTGPIVFRRYWHNEQATAEAIEDGWFHSGDIGELDDAGFLSITGRKKEIIVTAGGKNVAPRCSRTGCGRTRWSASAWWSATGSRSSARWSRSTPRRCRGGASATASLPGTAPPTWWTTRTCVAEIADAVAEANKAVSRAEQIREFRILPVDFTEAGGELTPTMKVKRAVVAKTLRRRDREHLRAAGRRPRRGEGPRRRPSSRRRWATRAGHVQSRRIHSRPAAPIARARSGSPSRSATASASARTSRPSTTRPVRPSRTVSGAPPESARHHRQAARRGLQQHDAQALDVEPAAARAARQREHVADGVVGRQLRRRHRPGEHHVLGHARAGGEAPQPVGVGPAADEQQARPRHPLPDQRATP